LLPQTLARLSTQVGSDQLVLNYLTEKDHPWLRALLDEYERGVGSKQSDLLSRLREPLTTPAPKAKQRLAVDVLQRACGMPNPTRGLTGTHRARGKPTFGE